MAFKLREGDLIVRIRLDGTPPLFDRLQALLRGFDGDIKVAIAKALAGDDDIYLYEVDEEDADMGHVTFAVTPAIHVVEEPEDEGA